MHADPVPSVVAPLMNAGQLPVPLAGKARTLEALAPHLRHGRVLPLLRFGVARWRRDPAGILARLTGLSWGGDPLIVRSSAADEDGTARSCAGRYRSVLDVRGDAVAAAVAAVIASYAAAGDDTADDCHEVLVQPMLRGVRLSGVAFSHDPNTGAPYAVINYEAGSDTTAVTGGHGAALRTRIVAGEAPSPPPAPLDRVLALLREVADLTGGGPVDIEFALAASDEGPGDTLYLLQARPLVMMTPPASVADAAFGGEADAVPRRAQKAVLTAIAAQIDRANRPHPYLHGRRTVFGVMPDWNPAEIVGTRPRPLALSLYREIITDSIWAYQRHNYGYRNLRSFPLMVSFEGLPYIDVRVSFNSFIPADIEAPLAERLADAYLDRLVAEPHLHDKVEFEIVRSCYTFDMADRMAPLASQGFSGEEIATLTGSLRTLTNRIIDREQGLCRHDLERIEVLKTRRATILASDLDDVARIYWLLEDCKRYGTLPFAGLARGGFIAMQMLNSLVTIGVLTPESLGEFIAGLDTVSARLGRDLRVLDRDRFLNRYGHLRPGTYDILSHRYDEAPDLYFPDLGRDVPAAQEPEAPPFQLSLRQLRQIGDLLRQHGLTADVVGLFDFFETGVRGREYAKFVFSHSLSDALAVLGHLGRRLGFSLDDLSYLDIRCIYDAYTCNLDVEDAMARSIAQGRERYRRTQQVVLPPLISGSEDVWAFELTPGQPNYVTQGRVLGPVVRVDQMDRMAGAIVMIPSADPGYDWIFHRGIRGFITAYGGINSHMAIRAGELGVPAVIGAGEVLFQRWSAAATLEIDAANRLVRVLQ